MRGWPSWSLVVSDGEWIFKGYYLGRLTPRGGREIWGWRAGQSVVSAGQSVVSAGQSVVSAGAPVL